MDLQCHEDSSEMAEECHGRHKRLKQSVVPLETTVNDDSEHGKISKVSVQKLVTHIHFGTMEKMLIAACEIAKTASTDPRMQKSLGEMGVISALINLLNSPDNAHRVVSLEALVALSAGNHRNKSLIAEAGGVEKICGMLSTHNSELRELACLTLLSMSSHDRVKELLTSSNVLSHLINTLKIGSCRERLASLGTLYNLSFCIEAAQAIVQEGGIESMPELLRDEETQERSLAMSVNLIVLESAVEKMINNPEILKNLIDILGCENSTRKSKDRSSYILMVLAKRSIKARAWMVEGGIVHSIIQVALLCGSPLAEKRSLKILEILRSDKHVEMSCNGARNELWQSSESEMREQKRAVKNMVEKSLHFNMNRMMSRGRPISLVIS